MKKIVVLGSLALSLTNFRYQMLETMVKCGFEVIACAPHASNDIIKKLELIGVKYRHVALENTGLNPFKDVLNCWKMSRTFKNINPDYILSYTMKPVIYGSLAARIAGINNIYSMITGLGYGFTSSTVKAKIVGFIMSNLLRIALYFNNSVFFQNPDDIKFFKKRAILKDTRKIKLINGSGVNLDFYKKTPLPAKPSFLLIARLIKDKGINEYVNAARIVKKQFPDIKFNLAGWIDNNPSSITKETLDLWTKEGIIDFLGMLDDVRPAIQNCSVYVLPSYREGTPRTVLEAMSIGRAIITTDAPGCRETVKDGENGFLVPVKDHLYLADKMIELINSPNKLFEMSEKSYILATDKYDVHKVNAMIMKNMGLEQV
ncbi:glycosyltransferase family 4 protein [Pseudemcibacter aquimaris]|uniref:glycosyltransferase family 4 protein n=1 Tax=Pseudemcibacter aquimaris TaxID=2857064 RepID=UPI0020112D13|nr:glycosyltransferase family 4 protein [Pseudemcibacter aquimaris]MCC3861728.1 glycosyltransferase family 4 protein [Pseudemcibacter aquimaris]WDU58497.1 glycosyltransferase family 4 protein [Pseudemcibacter aquimaris]